MERERPVGVERTIGFLRESLRAGAHLKEPHSRSAATWTRQRNVVGSYFGSSATLQDLARIYGLKRERIRQIVKGGIENLWQNCSPEIQSAFPLSDLPLGKPFSLSLKTREKLSQAAGGAAFKVRRLLEEGKTIEEIQERTGLSSTQLGWLRRKLRRCGVELPYLRTDADARKQFAEVLQAAGSDEEIQELLGQVWARFYKQYSRGENPLLLSIRKLASGFHYFSPDTILFVQALKRNGIPVGKIEYEAISGRRGQKVTFRYFFIVAVHCQRAREVLEADSSLKRFLENPLKQIAGS